LRVRADCSYGAAARCATTTPAISTAGTATMMARPPGDPKQAHTAILHGLHEANLKRLRAACHVIRLTTGGAHQARQPRSYARSADDAARLQAGGWGSRVGQRREVRGRRMILIIFALMRTNRQSCQGTNVRRNTVQRVGRVT